MSAPIRSARKPQTAPDTPPTPAAIALSDIAEIRRRANGTDAATVTLTADRLAGVLRIAEDLWYTDTLGWSMLSYNGIALDASNLRRLLGEFVLNGEAVPVPAIAVLESIAASIDARAVYGEGGRAADFTLVMREKGGAS
jgi:hypothetical protein